MKILCKLCDLYFCTEYPMKTLNYSIPENHIQLKYHSRLFMLQAGTVLL